MGKRGQAEQFNWIFVIVAGTIILSFFVMFIFKYVELQEKRRDVETVRFFSSGVLSASSKLQVGSGGAAVDSQGDGGIRFGYSTNLGYSCIDNQASVLIKKGDTAWYNLKDEVVFMDREINFGVLDGVDLWILPWSYPFHITNFIYLANSKTNFYFVYDNVGRELIDQLDVSSVFNVNLVREGELSSVSSDSKVVYFTRRESSISSINEISRGNSNVNFVHVINNKARFFDGERWSDAIQFYGLEQLYGAIFSNDAETFECNINRSLERAKIISKIYAQRAVLLSQMDRREGCSYAGFVGALNQYAAGNFDVLQSENLVSGGCVWVY